MQQFDPNIPPFITGDITSVTVTEIPEIGLPNHVINPTKEVKVEIKWELNGVLVPLWLTALGGNWNVSVYAESLGGGNEILLGTDDSVPALPPANNYSSTVIVPPPFPLQEHTPNTDQGGIYKLVVAVSLDSTLGGPFDIIGFSEGPIIQVENPV